MYQCNTQTGLFKSWIDSVQNKMSETEESLFDIKRAKATVLRGGRSRWLERKGRTAARFYYVTFDGKRVDADVAERIKALVIPPAWTDVRINPKAKGKIQVVGIDGKRRVQYMYEASFAERQQRAKYAKITRFGELIPKLIDQTNIDIRSEGLSKEKVLAVVMRLINSLYFRMGSDLSVKHYKTFGITTIQKRHLRIGAKGKLEFEFVGKSHVPHRKIFVDAELAAIVKQIAAVKGGRKLFRYLDVNGKPKAVTPADVNRYIKMATSEKFTAKDLRTWGGTLLAAVGLAEHGCCDDEAENKKRIVKVIKSVAEELGNTPTVCRSSYVHPAVLKAFEKGATITEFLPSKKRKIKRLKTELLPEEKALIKLLETYG